MKFQNRYARQPRPVTMEEIRSNRNLRSFYRIIRFSRLLRVALGICLILLIVKVGV